MNIMKIKLFVTYKELRTHIKSNIITPIQTGRAIAREVFKEMIGDDTGDNISEKNIRFEKYANVTFDKNIYKNRKVVLDYLKKIGIESIGCFGKWDYLWTFQAFKTGMEINNLVVSNI